MAVGEEEKAVGKKMNRRTAMMAGAGAAGAVLAPGRLLARGTRPAWPPGSTRVGVTLGLGPFPSSTTYEQAVRDWNQRTGTFTRCWKLFYAPGDFSTTNEPQIQACLEFGIQALICLKPSITPSPSDRAALSSLLAGLRRRGLSAEVCLWQEVTPADMTVAQYQTYVQYYGPAVRQYYPLVFDAPGHLGPTEWAAYDPGHSYVDGYAVDYYGSQYTKGVMLDGMATIAGNRPLGVWEMGNTQSQANPLPTDAQVTDYWEYVTSFLTERRRQRLPVGNVLWYNVANKSMFNEMVATDTSQNTWLTIDLQRYRKLYWSLNQVL